MNTTTTTLLAANVPHIPYTAVIGGTDYVQNPSRTTPRGGALWLSTGPYRLRRDYIHAVQRGCERPQFYRIPAGSAVSLHRAGNAENCSVWKIALPKGRVIESA